MNKNDFWSLIDKSKSDSKGDLSRQVELLTRRLQERSEEEILEFDHWLHEQMRRSYTRELWAAAYIINGGCSDDGFDYFRAWLIAQGRDVFQNALHDPESLVDVAEADMELELFLYAGIKAYEAKTNSKFPYPSRPAAELSGAEWEEDEEHLKSKYPKLFARFWETDAPQKRTAPASGLAPIKHLLEGLAARDKPVVSPLEALYRAAVVAAMDETPEGFIKSAALATQAADQGHAGAQFLVGTYLQHGSGVPQSYPKAALRYRQAAENGNADACQALGRLYRQGLELDQDFAEAFKWFQKGAELGSSGSEFELGVLYASGTGVEKNLRESFKWFHRAAQNGHVTAALNVGVCFLNGKGVDPDPVEAFNWFRRAADGGSAKARFNLGVLYEHGRGVGQDLGRAINMYQMAADQGFDGAMVNLGIMYSSGKGVARDDAKAVGLYRRAVEAGNLTALSNLAGLYQHGRGVPQDHAEAFRLYKQSADAGSAIGQYNLGTLFQRGIGTSMDIHEALRWYRLAAAQNNGPAMNNLGDAYEHGRGVTQDYAEAAQWYRRAAEHGIAPSLWSLGIFYRDGLGVTKDTQEAEKWLKAAAEKGYEKAKSALAELRRAAGHPESSPPAVVPTNPPPTGAVSQPGSASDQKLVSPQEAARRALCLRAFLRRCHIEARLLVARQNPGGEAKLRSGVLETAARDINGWLKDEALWLAASSNEKKALSLVPGSWSEQLIKNASWREQALTVIWWALGLTDGIPPYDAQAVGLSLAALTLLSSPRQFVSDAKLRPEKDIFQAREIAENWLWRARTTQIQKEPEKYPPPPGWTYEKIIAAAADHWEKEGLFKALERDYPARGKPYSKLSEYEWFEMRSIATERLYGLNWLCRYSANWDSVPTET
jgi:TPR repeat protein